MTNKELILTKINELRFTNKHGDEFEQGYNNALDCIEYFINNSLPAKQRSVDLEEAANKYADDNPSLCLENDGGIYEDFNAPRRNFIAGAQWQKEQMMKSAVDATCVLLPPPDLFKVLICHDVTNNLSKGQKVKIITVTVKEDEQ